MNQLEFGKFIQICLNFLESLWKIWFNVLMPEYSVPWIFFEGGGRDVSLWQIYTEVYTIDETSETTIRNFYCLFPLFKIPWNCKPVSFFVKSFYKLLKYNTKGSWLSLTLESSYFKRFRSSLQSHPLWVTL